MKTLLTAMLLLSATGALAQYSPQPLPTMPLRTFQDSIGVNVHMEYTDGLYANEAQVIADLKYLGINHVRDAVPLPGYTAPDGLQHMKDMLAKGILFDLIASSGETPAANVQQIDLLGHPEAVTSIEGLNEINNLSGTYHNEAAAEQFQKSLYAAVKADSNLASLPVLYFTGGAPIANMAGMADVANTHPYPSLGVQPFARLQSDFLINFPNLHTGGARQITENGYATDLVGGDPNAVDETTQAELELTVFFDAALQGNQRAYMYQLLEPYSDVRTNSDTAYGMFHYEDDSPKDIAIALHNMAAVIPLDKPSPQKTFAAAIKISATNAQGNEVLEDLPSTAHTLALTGSDGTVYLWMWNEQPVWNSNTQTPIMNQPLFVYVQPAQAFSTTALFFAPDYMNLAFGPAAIPSGQNSNGTYYQALIGDRPSCFIFHTK